MNTNMTGLDSFHKSLHSISVLMHQVLLPTGNPTCSDLWLEDSILVGARRTALKGGHLDIIVTDVRTLCLPGLDMVGGLTRRRNTLKFFHKKI